MHKKKILIISYYWPPSGGAGVQRWLKLSKYLSQLGMDVHVLTVHEDSASYMHLDHSLLSDTHLDVKVYKTKSFEPIKLYAKIFGKEKVPTAGFSNVDNTRFSQKLVNSLRSHLFIPDPRKGWKKYAVKKALEIINKERIQTIITTSPPHSTHLIGLQLKSKLKINWLVDFRDPWTDIYYYGILGHSTWSRKKDQKLEKQVVETSDKIITVSEGFKNIFLSKSEAISNDKISVIPNGFDPADFQITGEKLKNPQCRICYTGTMSNQYEPEVFFDALNEVIVKNPNIKVIFQWVGILSSEIKKYIESLNIPFEYISTVTHEEVLVYQKQADLLLLVLPKVAKAEGIIPGKIFEYLASGNRIISLGPSGSDIAKILDRCQAGQNFNWDERSEIIQFLDKELSCFNKCRPVRRNENEISKFSRAYQAEQVKALLEQM